MPEHETRAFLVALVALVVFTAGLVIAALLLFDRWVPETRPVPTTPRPTTASPP